METEKKLDELKMNVSELTQNISDTVNSAFDNISKNLKIPNEIIPEKKLTSDDQFADLMNDID